MDERKPWGPTTGLKIEAGAKHADSFSVMGTGFHSSTSQLNLSHFGHGNHPIHPADKELTLS